MARNIPVSYVYEARVNVMYVNTYELFIVKNLITYHF